MEKYSNDFKKIGARWKKPLDFGGYPDLIVGGGETYPTMLSMFYSHSLVG